MGLSNQGIIKVTILMTALTPIKVLKTLLRSRKSYLACFAPRRKAPKSPPTLQVLLVGSWDLVSKVISTLIAVISTVTLIITPVTKSHDPLSGVNREQATSTTVGAKSDQVRAPSRIYYRGLKKYQYYFGGSLL